jgi:hypothetical protein
MDRQQDAAKNLVFHHAVQFLYSHRKLYASNKSGEVVLWLFVKQGALRASRPTVSDDYDVRVRDALMKGSGILRMHTTRMSKLDGSS